MTTLQERVIVLRRLLIAGPGRSGTTALVQILADAGLSTTAAKGRYFAEARAGFEGGLTDRSPQVVKSPHLTFQLPKMLADGVVKAEDIQALLLPIRDLEQVAGSRTANALRLGSPRGPGALFGTTRPTRQADALGRGLADLVLACEEHGIPYVFLLYPRFTHDFDYLWNKLDGLLDGVAEDALRRAWLARVDPSLQATYPAPTWRDDVRLSAKHALRRLRHPTGGP